MKCWIWPGKPDKDGYARVHLDFKTKKLHRVMYEVAFGTTIPEGLVVCHKCDTPGCINPDHLFLGTIDDNNKDKAKKGRAAKQQGAQHGGARLGEIDVKFIRAWAVEGYTQSELSCIFGISRGTVSKIINKQRWSHI